MIYRKYDIFGHVPVIWKVKDYLTKEKVSAYRFMKETGLSQQVAYAIARQEHSAVDVRVIDKVLPFLRELTCNENLQVGDIIEYVAE